MSAEEIRQERLAAEVGDRQLDALLVSDLASIRYLTGYVGSNAFALVGPSIRALVTDGRYSVSAREQVRGAEVTIGRRDLVGDVARLVGVLGAAPHIGVEAQDLTLARHARLEEAMDGATLVSTTGLVEDQRVVKDPHEIDVMREAAAIADRALRDVLAQGIVGRRETEVALALHGALVDHGATEPSFPIIVAAGANGARPHAVPGADAIPIDTLCVIDLGARYNGYCSDMTRTVVMGDPPERLRAAYEVCRAAQEAALNVVAAGVATADVDRAARSVIDDAGFGEAFVHGLGHGVGLDIHERPGVRRESTEALLSGMVITIEPGIYLEGVGGVRLEDLVVVTDDGVDLLSHAPKDRTDKELTSG